MVNVIIANAYNHNKTFFKKISEYYLKIKELFRKNLEGKI